MESALRATGVWTAPQPSHPPQATAFGGTRFEYDEEHDLVEYERAVGLVGEGGGDTALRA
jgi:hypothetical protein